MNYYVIIIIFFLCAKILVRLYSTMAASKGIANSAIEDVGTFEIVCKGQPDFINSLNDDCLAAIFTYIPVQQRFTLQAVCKRWNSDLAWSDIRSLDFDHEDLSKFISRGNKGIARILKKCGRFLHQLDVGYVGRSTMLPIVGKFCYNLRRLVIRLDQNDTKCIDWLIPMGKMEFFQITADRQHFSETFFQSLSHGNFTGLHLSVSTDIVGWPDYPRHLPPATANILEKLPRLTRLTLSGFVLTSNIVMILNRLSNLNYLSLAFCSAEEGLPHMERLIKLEYLDVTNVSQVDNRFIIEVSQNCLKLQVLRISHCTKLSDVGITTLQTLSQLQKLIVIGVSKITDQSLSKLHSLKILDCEDCREIKNNGIITLIRYAPNLEYLNLIHTGVTCKVLKEANKILGRRTNDIILRIDIDHSATGRWIEDKCPPLLNVRGFLYA